MVKFQAVDEYVPPEDKPISSVLIRSVKLFNNSVTKKLDLQTIDNVAGEVLQGVFPHIAAGKYGIIKQTFDNWLLQGEQLYTSLPQSFDLENSVQSQDLWDQFNISEKLLIILYVQVQLAYSEARSLKEAQIYKSNPSFWLQFGPGKVDWSPQSKLDIDISATIKNKMPAKEAKELLRLYNAR